MPTNEEMAVRVSGEQHEHPAIRQLARACIALVRWRRGQAAIDVSRRDGASDHRGQS